MAILLWVMVSLIQSAYYLHDKTVGAMLLQESIEICRQDESLRDTADIVEETIARGGHPLSFSAYSISLDRGNHQVTGESSGNKWKLKIKINQYDPEQFLRMSTLVDGLVEK